MSTALQHGAPAGALTDRRGVALRGRRAATMLTLLVASQTMTKAARDALFLAEFDLTHLAVIAIGLAALAGLAASLFLRATAGMPRDRVIVATYVGIALSLVALRLLFVSPAVAAWLPGLLYVWSSLFGIFTLVQFWQLAGDLFHAREARRSYALLGAGGIVGGIAGGVLSGLLAPALGAPSLLLVSAALLVAAARQAQRLWPLRVETAPAPETPRAGGLSLILGDRFLLVIAVAQVLSTAAITLLDFQFKGIARATFEGRPDEMASFFGAVQGGLSVLSLAFQLGATGWILRRLGIGAGLLALPTSVVLGGIAILFSGFAPIGRLWVVSAARVAEGSLRFAVDKASMELLWAPVPRERREIGKTLVDTLADRIGTAGSGVLWLALVGLGLGRPEHLHLASVLVLGLALAWILVVVRMRHSYVDQLRHRYADAETGTDRLRLPDAAARPAVAEALASSDPQAVRVGLQLLAGWDGPLPDLAPVLTHGDPEIRAEALRVLHDRADRNHLEEARALLEDPDPLVREAALIHLCGAGTAVGAASGIPCAPLQPTMPLAMASPAEVDATLRGIRATRAVELLPRVFDLLGDRRYRGAAVATLHEMREEAERIAVDRLGGDRPGEERLAILRLLGGSSDPGVAPAILRMLDHPEPVLADAALRALVRLRHRTGVAVDERRVRRMLRREIRGFARALLTLGRGAWPACRATPPADLLERALLEDCDRRARRVFELVALPRSTRDLWAVWQGIRNSSAVRRSGSIEFLDNLLDPFLRAELLPLLEAGSHEELAAWAQARLGLVRERPAESIARLLRGSVPWLRQVAAFAAGERRVVELHALLVSMERASGGLFAEELRSAIGRIEGSKEDRMALTLVEKVLQLQSVDVLHLASSEDLAFVARIAKEVEVEEGAPIYAEGDPPDALFVVVKGGVRLHRGDEEIARLGAGEAFGTWALLDEAARVSSATACERSVLLEVDREEFLALLADRVDIVQAIFKAMVDRLRKLADLARGPGHG